MVRVFDRNDQHTAVGEFLDVVNGRLQQCLSTTGGRKTVSQLSYSYSTASLADTESETPLVHQPDCERNLERHHLPPILEKNDRPSVGFFPMVTY